MRSNAYDDVWMRKIKYELTKKKTPLAVRLFPLLSNSTRIVTHSLSTKQLIRSVLFCSHLAYTNFMHLYLSHSLAPIVV